MSVIAERRLIARVLRRILGNEASVKKKLVIMLGPPAAGKGFFLGEPEKDKETKEKVKYKTDEGVDRDTTFGYKLPKSTAGLFSDEDIPDKPDQDESDNHLRACQFEEAKKHFTALKAAHDQGEEAFDKAMGDHWYATKDGGTVKLGGTVKFSDFDGDEEHATDQFNSFFEKANKDFYVSMRGWHDDAKEENPETGKPRERFKDMARHRFDDRVRAMAENDDGSGMMIVDSAGEDIDTQDFKGQIEHAKAHGYDVTVIFLHPEQADTELSNLSRGKVMGKRMVDQSDISNWYERNEEALKHIADAAPDNFLHYRKGPPDADPKKAEEKRKKARELMNGLAEMSPDEQKAAKKEINKTLYADAAYELNKETSYGTSMKSLPDKAEKDIAETVKGMNDDAAKRVGDGGAPHDKAEDDKPKGEAKKDDGDKTRIKFVDEMGEKEVANPNFDGQKKDSPSNPRRRKIRNLPWKEQKKYYEQWSRAASSRPRVVQAARVVVLWQEKVNKMAADEEKGWLHGWMTKLAKELEKVKAEDYTVTAEAGSGPLVYMTIEGAEGDVSTLKKIKPDIAEIVKASIKEEVRNDKFHFTITSATRGDDMKIAVEIIFPKA